MKIECNINLKKGVKNMPKLTEEEKNEVKRLKAIPNKEMKSILEQFNKFLEKEKIGLVKIEKSKGRTLSNLVSVVQTIIEKGKVEIIPNEIVEFYNKYLVFEDEDEDDVKPDDTKPDDTKPTTQKKSTKKTKTKKEIDDYGFVVGSGNNLVCEILKTKATKMMDLKKELGNSYYTLMKKHPEIFAKNENLEWYILGSAADTKK